MARHVISNEYLYEVDKRDYKNYMEFKPWVDETIIRKLLNLLYETNWSVCPEINGAILTNVKKNGVEIYLQTNRPGEKKEIRMVKVLVNCEQIFYWKKNSFKKYNFIKKLEKAYMKFLENSDPQSWLVEENNFKTKERVYNYLFDDTV